MGSGVGENEFLGFTDDYGYSDFLDAIVYPDFEEPVARLLAEYLLDCDDVADCICLQHVSDESFMVRSLLPHLQERFKYLEKEQLDECPYISLPDSMKTYIKNIGSSSRRRRFRKNLKPAGNKYKVQEACTLEEVRSDVVRLHELHQERWHALGFPGAFSSTRYCRFFEEMSERAFRNGWLWLKKAKDEEGCAAIRWTLKYNNRFYDCTTGFDVNSPSAKYSPGLGLLAVLIDDAIRMGASRVELLRGTERYKFDFTRASRYNWRIRLPLYRKKPAYYAILNMGIGACGRLYATLKKEIKLLKTHRHRDGWMKALWSYGSFRLQRLKSKLKSINTIKKITERLVWKTQ
jgi:CelD/BcsL family acetyltransferase involved in cellulose biosynthesis